MTQIAQPAFSAPSDATPHFAVPATSFGTDTSRCPQRMLEMAKLRWGGESDLWVFGYASLIWRPEFDFIEQRRAKVHGWHRSLKMWSRINRGTPERPGLVANGTVMAPVPVTGLTPNFSPIPRMAPPPLGSEIVGTFIDPFPFSP